MCNLGLGWARLGFLERSDGFRVRPRKMTLMATLTTFNSAHEIVALSLLTVAAACGGSAKLTDASAGGADGIGGATFTETSAGGKIDASAASGGSAPQAAGGTVVNSSNSLAGRNQSPIAVAGGQSAGGAVSAGGTEPTGHSSATESTGGVSDVDTREKGGTSSTEASSSGPTGGVSSTPGTGADGEDASVIIPACAAATDAGEGLARQHEVLGLMRLANDYFVQKWPDPTMDIVTNYTDPSNVWHRAVYYEGLMALYRVETDSTRKVDYYDYALTWGASP